MPEMGLRTLHAKLAKGPMPKVGARLLAGGFVPTDP